MGKTKGPYKQEYPKDSTVQIADLAFLENFLKTWKLHHELEPQQLNYANKIAKVKSVGFYHGGDELYELRGVPGTWHEQWLQLVEEMPVANAEESSLPQGKIWLSLRWCLPALLGFLAFLVAFPIDRRIPHWSPLNFAELFTLWFLLVTPITTVIAIVTLLKRKRMGRIPPFIRLLAWTAIAVSILLNVFVLLGVWASTY